MPNLVRGENEHQRDGESDTAGQVGRDAGGDEKDCWQQHAPMDRRWFAAVFVGQQCGVRRAAYCGSLKVAVADVVGVVIHLRGIVGSAAMAAFLTTLAVSAVKTPWGGRNRYLDRCPDAPLVFVQCLLYVVANDKLFDEALVCARCRSDGFHHRRFYWS